MSRLRGNPAAVLAVLSVAYFMSQLDSTVIAVAIPRIAEDLHTGLDQVVWALSAYIFVLAVALITAGRLGDLYGRRRIFAAGILLFTVCSAAGGLAQNPAELIAARAVQGLGAALITPQTLALLVEVFPAERRGTALGIRGAAGGLAAVLGPAVGGLLVETLSWRWTFFINVPIGMGMLVLTWLSVPEVRRGGRPRLDLLGVALVSAALFCFTFAVSQGQRFGWNAGIWVLLVASAALGAWFVVQQRRGQGNEPLVDFSVFRDRNFALVNAFSLTTALTVIGLILVLSVFFQSVLRFGAFETGMLLVPASLLSMALDPVAGRLSDRVQGKYLLLAGLLLTLAGMLWSVAEMYHGVSWTAFLGPMCVIGIGNAFLFTPLAAVGLAGVPGEMAGAASGALVTSLQIGSVVGTALVGTFVQSSSSPPTTGSASAAMLWLAAIGVLGTVACVAARPNLVRAAAPPDDSPAVTSGEPVGDQVS